MENRVVTKGIYEGYPFWIELVDLGVMHKWHCGYVQLPADSKYVGVDYDSIPVHCHGGLTWSEAEENGYVIGFDCAHYGDRIEFQNEDYCANQCKSIIDQLIRLGGTQKC